MYATTKLFVEKRTNALLVPVAALLVEKVGASVFTIADNKAKRMPVKIGFNDGANADMWTGTHDYTPAEWKRFEDWLDRVYVDFTGKVAEGRNLPKDKVLQIAKGRIWSGQDAKNLGLVDELGGFDTALKLAKKAAGIPENEDVKLVMFPHRKNFVESLLQREGPDNSEREGASAALAGMLKAVQPVARGLRALGLDPAVADKKDQGDDILRMPAVQAGR